MVRGGEWGRAGVGGVRGVGWEGWGFGTQFAIPQPAPNPKIQLKAGVGGDRGGMGGGWEVWELSHPYSCSYNLLQPKIVKSAM